MGTLRYSSYDIVLQEVPNEISLCFTITGCPLACEGCHSEYIWDGSKGCALTNEGLEQLLSKYEDMISCVLFMGGEWQVETLLSLIFQVKCKRLKTALYTGLNLKQVQRKYPELLRVFRLHQNRQVVTQTRWTRQPHHQSRVFEPTNGRGDE